MTFKHLAPALLLLSFDASAAPARLHAPSAGDLTTRDIVASPAPSTAPVGGPVRFTWPIDQAADDLVTPTPHRAESTSHARTLTAAALRRGVTLPISQPAAFLKLSGDVAAGSVVLVDPRGRVARDGLRPVRGDLHAYTLDPALGVGVFTLQASAAGEVRLDVREPDSGIVLALQTAADVVFAGEAVRVQVTLLDSDGHAVPSARFNGRLLDPAGKDRGALVRGRDGRLHATVPARVDAHPPGALWTIDLTADATIDGVPVRRTVTTAFAVTVPTARPTGAADVDSTNGVRVALELDVASPGRYAATAVLYGTNREGQSQPISVGQSADELTPGRRTLTLEFDAAAITASGMRAPFELRDLRIADQGRMTVVHRQARGLSVAGR